MVDILIDKNGDLAITEAGDISLTKNICQAVSIRLRWIFNEWRLGPNFGFTWFEDVFVRNPNIENIKQLINNEIKKVEGVVSAEVSNVEYDAKRRKCKFVCKITSDNGDNIEEAVIDV